MAVTQATTDQAVLEEFGVRLSRRRVALGLTQTDLARKAGVSKRTLERLEAGHSCHLTSVVRILRVLDLLDVFLSILPDTGPSPMELLKTRGRRRQRASKKRDQQHRSWSWSEDDS